PPARRPAGSRPSGGSGSARPPWQTGGCRERDTARRQPAPPQRRPPQAPAQPFAGRSEGGLCPSSCSAYAFSEHILHTFRAVGTAEGVDGEAVIIPDAVLPVSDAAGGVLGGGRLPDDCRQLGGAAAHIAQGDLLRGALRLGRGRLCC